MREGDRELGKRISRGWGGGGGGGGGVFFGGGVGVQYRAESEVSTLEKKGERVSCVETGVKIKPRGLRANSSIGSKRIRFRTYLRWDAARA